MNKIKINKQLVVTLGMTTLFAACPTVQVFAASQGFDANSIGIKFWKIVKLISKWACIIMCAVRIVQNLGVEDAKGMMKIFFKYAFAYAIIVYLPSIFDGIDE